MSAKEKEDQRAVEEQRRRVSAPTDHMIQWMRTWQTRSLSNVVQLQEREERERHDREREDRERRVS